jgi:hypothetical protein
MTKCRIGEFFLKKRMGVAGRGYRQTRKFPISAGSRENALDHIYPMGIGAGFGTGASGSSMYCGKYLEHDG